MEERERIKMYFFLYFSGLLAQRSPLHEVSSERNRYLMAEYCYHVGSTVHC
jgi:hypothetical protein